MKNLITKEQFNNLLEQLKVSPLIDRDLIFEAYEFAFEGASKLSEANVMGKVVPINSVTLILYLINEFGFFLDTHKVTSEQIKDDEKANSQIVSFAVDKYFTNEHLNFKNERIVSKYSPIVSNLDLYLNFILGMLNRFPRKNPNETLLCDVMIKGFSLMKAILEMLISGFGTEAFSLWRTLHENECILLLLNQHGTPVQEAYVKHLQYGVAFRNGLGTKEATDAMFVQIKSEMKALDLKSKDMKKFIEYGWLTAVPNYNESKEFKFNFRDGVERLAGLNSYSKLYEMASELAHSSPILIYSSNEYYFHVAMLTVYECFFRFENVFAKFYEKQISEEELKRYSVLKKAYYPMLQVLYEKEKQAFKNRSIKRAEK